MYGAIGLDAGRHFRESMEGTETGDVLCGLASRLGGVAVAVLPGDQQFAQQMKITPQNAQLDVAAKAAFTAAGLVVEG